MTEQVEKINPDQGIDSQSSTEPPVGEAVNVDVVEAKPAPGGGNKRGVDEDRDSVGIVRCVLVAVVCSVLSVVVYDQFFAQKVVAIDLKGIVEQMKEQVIAGTITEAQVKERLDAVQEVVVSTPKRKVILMGDAVVRNVETLKP